MPMLSRPPDDPPADIVGYQRPLFLVGDAADRLDLLPPQPRRRRRTQQAATDGKRARTRD
jgi:hypothetical protein